MSKLNEIPLRPTDFSDDQMVQYSKDTNPKPWRIAHHKSGNGYSQIVIVDSLGKIVSGRAACVRICRAINSTEVA